MPSTAGYDIVEEFHWLAILDGHDRALLSHRADSTSEAIEPLDR